MILATLVALVMALGAGAADSLECQRATALGAWSPASAWAGPGPALVRYVPPMTTAVADTDTFYVSQSTATSTRCTYRVRIWHAGRVSGWSPVAGIVTAAHDSSYTLMRTDGRLVNGTWVQGVRGATLSPTIEPFWRADSTIRCVSGRDVQTFWYARIMELYGYVR